MTQSDAGHSLSVALVSLMKGVTFAESDPALWQSLVGLQPRIRDYVTVLGLDLIVDEAEGFAYLRQRPTADGEPELPRLIPRRQLGYPVSLLIALLRKTLAEFEVASGDTRLILGHEDIVEMMRVFLPDTVNQARLMDRIDQHINRVIDMGFLRRLAGRDDQFEVRRVLKAFVDAQWLNEFEQRLAAYRHHLSSLDAVKEALS
jgi:Domain of unknown function (DUF4194)